MKRQSILLLCTISTIIFLTHTSFAQEAKKPVTKEVKVKWYSFEDAYKLNKKKPKKMMIDVYTDWCGWCKKMDAETFANPVIAAYMNEHYYCVKLDAERKDTVEIDGVKFVNPNPSVKRSTHQLANEMLRGQMSYPSYAFLNEKGQIITVVPGYQQAPAFECILNYFGQDAYLATKWEDFQTTFKGQLK
jgi:thioredoxin-related protein